ncbi:MAG: extracellular solute-binding protein, partial [Hungatella sp.]
GITKVPATLEELVETSKTITSKLSGEGIYGFASNLKSVSSALNRSFALGIARETGTWNGFDFQKGEYDFNCYADALKLWKELLSEGSAFPGCESLDIDPLRTQFAAGKIGMYCSYTAAEPGVYANQFPLDYSKWDCAPIPTTGGKEVGRQNFEGTNGYLLNAKSENIEAAFKAYKDIFTSEDYLKGYYEAAYGISIVPSIIEGSSPAGAYKDSKWLLLTDKDGILPLAPHDVNANAVLVEGQDMYSTLGNILLGDAPIEATLKDLTDRYNAAYKKGIADGTGKEIKIENYDPMNPS